MEMANPLAAFREGWDTVQGIRDARTQRQAGNALAGGDYGGASNAFLQGGMLDEGMQIQAIDQRRQQQALDAQQEQAKAAKLQQAEHLKSLLGGAQALRQLPPEARRQAYQAQVYPLLAQAGLDRTPEGQSMLAHFGQAQFTDQELDAFIATMGGELQKPEWQVVNLGSGGGVIAVDQRDPSRRQVIEGPNRQPRVIEAQDGIWQEQPDGSWKRVGQFAPQAKTFAPKGGGRGRGRGSAPSGSSQLPAGFVLE